MFPIYIAFLIFGGAFTIPMIFGALDTDTDVDADFDGGADFDVDVDADVDVDTDAGGGSSSSGGSVGEFGSIFASLFSFRSIVFGATFFGLTGTVLHFLDASQAVTIVSAVVMGFVASLLNATLWSQLRRTGDVTSNLGRGDLVGATGQVVVPISEERRGRVRLELNGQPRFMVATPFRTKGAPFNPGDRVVVVEVDGDIAKIAPLNELES